MSRFLTVSEVARKLGARPRDISDLFYQRKLPDTDFPVVSGRRLIAPECVPQVREALQRAGRDVRPVEDREVQVA